MPLRPPNGVDMSLLCLKTLGGVLDSGAINVCRSMQILFPFRGKFGALDCESSI